MADSVDSVEIAAPPERVHEALTTAAGVRAWWTRDADLESTVGGRGHDRRAGNGCTSMI